MSRYFFNIRDGHDVIADIAGSNFANDALARLEAIDRAQMIAEMGQFEEPSQQVEVYNAEGMRVARVRIADQLHS